MSGAAVCGCGGITRPTEIGPWCTYGMDLVEFCVSGGRRRVWDRTLVPTDPVRVRAGDYPKAGEVRLEPGQIFLVEDPMEGVEPWVCVQGAGAYLELDDSRTRSWLIGECGRPVYCWPHHKASGAGCGYTNAQYLVAVECLRMLPEVYKEQLREAGLSVDNPNLLSYLTR